MGKKLTRLVKMKFVLLACILAGISPAKISPFLPREIVKHDVDIARAQHVKEKRDLAQALKAEKVGKLEEKPLIAAQEESTTTTTTGDPDEKSDVVPIVVGSVMGGIIVV